MQTDTSAPQPRFAAFLSSLGREQTMDEAHRFTRAHTNVPFMGFISRARASAPESIVHQDQVIDHDAFTAHCWSVARDECLRNFPAA